MFAIDESPQRRLPDDTDELREEFAAAHQAMIELVNRFGSRMPSVMAITSAGWGMAVNGAESASAMLRELADKIDGPMVDVNLTVN